MIYKGDIDEIRFRNDENGFSIVIIDCQGEPITCAGIFPPITEGQSIQVVGNMVMHPKFGQQVKVDQVTITKPTSLDGIVRYLGSGIIKGIGPKTALKIVDMYGTDTLQIIENSPEKLAKVKGITIKKAQEIAQNFNAIRDMQESIMFLQEYNISLNLALKIYKQYGLQTQTMMKVNPYRLIEDVDGVGFMTADKIAKSLGIKQDSDFRVRAGLIYTLKETARLNGNTYLPYDQLVSETQALINVKDELISDNIDKLIIDRKIKSITYDGENRIMLLNMFYCEKNIANKLVQLLQGSNRVEYDCEQDIKNYEMLHNISFHDQQRDAIKSGINSGVCLITGGPGTGKTTIIKCILSIFDKLGITYELMAPTGRASKRMSEATGEEASTIHRACGIRAEYSETEVESLHAQAIIVDEFSMVDEFLFNALLKRINIGSKLILVGDKDQLPSVGAGNVLADIMKTGIVKIVQLTQIYRQAEESLIITNAHAINRGEMPVLNDKKKDFFFLKLKDPVSIANTTVDMVCRRVSNFLDIDPMKVQVLCPMKNGYAGTININNMIQAELKGDEQLMIETTDYTFKKGDKVMHIVNNYELEWKIAQNYTYKQGAGVFNGDMGEIIDIDLSNKQVVVLFEDGRQVTYTQDILNQLILAYAVTVHKSQGSEYDVVVMPISSGSPMILTRNLLYTAITRAKRMVVLIGDDYNIKRMVDNNYIAIRYSSLDLFIQQNIKDNQQLYSLM